MQPVTEVDGLITATPFSGAVPAAPAEPAASPAPLPVRSMRSVDAEEADRTQLADPGDPAGPGLYLGGTALSLVPPSVLGRNPAAPGSHPDAVPLPVDDPLASKTHLLVGRDEQGPWVIDLHSTNGVSVAPAPGVAPQRIQAGRKVHLAAGAAVTFAGHSIAVR
nr:FHA domain-containing protein [Propionibacterium sp.]